MPEDWQAEVLSFVEDLAELETEADNRHAAERVAIWDKIEEIMRDVAAKFWQAFRRIPTEASINFDYTFMVPLRSNHEPES